MKAYIAGPMSGIPKFNIPAFDAAAEDLRSRGHEVVSPAEVDGPELRAVYLESADGSHGGLETQEQPYSYYLDRDIDIIRAGGFDMIVTLPGWERSPGANREVGFALGIGVPRYDYDPSHASGASYPGASEVADLYDEDGKFIKFSDHPLRQRAVTGGVKDNKGKPRVDLIPSKPLLGVGRVLAFGASKYKPHNWRLGLGWSDTIGSAMRHVIAFADGEDIDPDSKECHVDNAICQLMFLSEYYHTETGIDDRWSSRDTAGEEAAKA